jgi:esterase/lipase
LADIQIPLNTPTHRRLIGAANINQRTRQMTDRIDEIRERITAYLSMGGLFNPELANHDAVRDLIIDCRDVLLTEIDRLTEELSIWKSVFPDIAPQSVMPNRSLLEAELAAKDAEIERLRAALVHIEAWKVKRGHKREISPRNH